MFLRFLDGIERGGWFKSACSKTGNGRASSFATLGPEKALVGKRLRTEMPKEATNRFAGKKVTVMGLGLFGGGVGVARFLVKQGAQVTITDLRPPSQLAESIQALSSLPLTFHLGGHTDTDFTNADLVVVNPAVPLDSPYLEAARKAGVPLDSEMNIFLSLCRAKIIGVTGTNGKTTTTALIGEMLATQARRVWVGGNIGVSLLDQVEEMKEDDVVVLEMSSFQLDMLDWVGISPTTSVVTNISENHLDRHGTMARYIAAKQKIFAFQRKNELTVLNHDDPEVATWANVCPGRVAFFSRKERVRSGAFVQGDTYWLAESGEEIAVCRLGEALIPGWFNQENILAAICAAAEHGARPAEMARAIRSFRGVEHRLELVAEIGGVRYYNDSIATNPKSTMAALDALEGRIILIAGGYDKKLSLAEVARVIARRCKAVVLAGETAPTLAALIEAEPGACPVSLCKTFDDAVATAHDLAQQGDTVLLSPACASFDMFRNFAERGRRFKELVQTFARS